MFMAQRGKFKEDFWIHRCCIKSILSVMLKIVYFIFLFFLPTGLEREDLLNLPCGVGLILGEAIQTVTENPCQGWPDEVYKLISRSDLLPLSKETAFDNYKLPTPSNISPPPLDTNTKETDQVGRSYAVILFNH